MTALKPEWVYLSLAVPFGVAFLVLTPPFQVPDEEGHLRRAFALSEGHFVPIKRGDVSGDEQPRGLQGFTTPYARICGHPEQKTTASEILGQLEIRFDPKDRAFFGFTGSAICPPVPYVPQASGIFFARMFSTSALICFTAGRVLNFVAATLLTFLAIRVTPVGQAGLAALSLLPMTLSLNATLSPDALTNALAFLLIAHLLACALGPAERLSLAALVGAVLLGACVGLTKQGYFLLPLCYLLIPVRKFATSRAYWLGLALVVGSGLVAAAAWGYLVRNAYVPSDPRLGPNPARQLHWMHSNPLAFGRTLLQTGASFRLYVEEFVGWLGLVDLRLPGWIYLVEIAVVAAAFLSDGDLVAKLSVRQALLAGAVALLAALIIVVGAYVAWNPVGAGSIGGLQGRYFIPLAPLAGVALGRAGGLLPGAVRSFSGAGSALLAVATPVLLTGTLLRVYDRYFVDSPRAAARRCSFRGETLAEAGRTAQALEQFKAALSIDPDHVTSHLWLGHLLRDSRPDEAAEHYRAAIRVEPANAEALNGLATVLAQREDYAEAISLFREALRLDPQATHIHGNLRNALQAQQERQSVLQEISRICENVARSTGALEKRPEGAPEEGWFFKPNRGRFLDADGKNPIPAAEFLWRCPSPGEEGALLLAPQASAPGSARRTPFFACSTRPMGGKRVFVFRPPTGAREFADEEVSWFFQVPLAELDDQEREKESTYRQRLGLHFPLEKPPP